MTDLNDLSDVMTMKGNPQDLTDEERKRAVTMALRVKEGQDPLTVFGLRKDPIGEVMDEEVIRILRGY